MVSHANLPSGILPFPMGKYLVVTCGLCGFSEFYDQAVFEACEEAATKAVPVAGAE